MPIARELHQGAEEDLDTARPGRRSRSFLSLFERTPRRRLLTPTSRALRGRSLTISISSRGTWGPGCREFGCRARTAAVRNGERIRNHSSPLEKLTLGIHQRPRCRQNGHDDCPGPRWLALSWRLARHGLRMRLVAWRSSSFTVWWGNGAWRINQPWPCRFVTVTK